MTVLMASLIATWAECYDRQNRAFIDENFQLMLDGIEGRYSADFVSLLNAMLQTDPQARMSFDELDKTLGSYWQ